MKFALDNLRHPPRYEQDGPSLLLEVPPGRSLRRTKRDALKAFTDVGVRAFFLPMRTEQREPASGTWEDIGPGPHPTLPPPAPTADRIRWVVSVTPTDAFHWRELRDAVAWCGRTVLAESDHDLEIGAADEDDARALAGELEVLAVIRTATDRKLGWFSRWLVRERLLGNYAGGGDPIQPG
jgi:hypothetical protein